tara:strand:+ start:877 stop:1077 length:201 start_codon:yes stop_codon:yes gene_type:complete
MLLGLENLTSKKTQMTELIRKYRISQIEIAKRAGLDPTVVSRVLSPKLNGKINQAVMDIIAERKNA